MYPVLFEIGPLKADTYYVFWGVALCVAVLWMRKRCVSRYGISFNDASSILIWMIFGVFIGASLGGYLDNWTRYAESPVRLLYFWESGLSSGPGFIGGGLAGLYKIRKLSVSVDNFAEAASVPCAFMIFIGRWGCFFNGCCAGIATNAALAVRFPRNPSASVYPTQLFESFTGLVIGIFLLILEKKLGRSQRESARGAVLWPVFMITYGLYRFVIDFIRAGDRIFGLRVGQYTGLLAVAAGILWLANTRRRIRNAS
jgi:phosphatidylglycerol:prolipoprotein diacylglycerol transferase